LAGEVLRGVESLVERLGCEVGGLSGIDPGGANLGSDAGLVLLKGCTRGRPVLRGAEMG
jgi:hypothetical protein